MYRFPILSVLEFMGLGAVVLDRDLTILQSNEYAELIETEVARLGDIVTGLRPFLTDWLDNPDKINSVNRQEWFIFKSPERRPIVFLCIRMRTRSASNYMTLAFIDFNRSSSPKQSVLRNLFNLTNAECEVARRVAQGQSLSTIAAELGVAVATVRVQLRSVFAKTHTSRQSELAAVLGLSSILPSEESITQLRMEDFALKPARGR